MRPDATPVGRIFEILAHSREAPLLRFEGKAFGAADLAALASAHSRRLADLGFRRGDRIAVFAENGPDLIAALLAHLQLGLIHVPVNTRYREEEVRHILEDSGARGICFEGSEGNAILERVGPLPRLEHRIDLKAQAEGEGLADPSPAATGALADRGPKDADTALLIYTSGTTGKSKGVALSYRALVENTLAVTRSWRFSEADRVAIALPLFHVHGLCLGAFGAFLNGATLLLFDRFDASRIVDAFERDGATVFMGVPTMYVRLLEHLGRHPAAAEPLRSARLFTAGSAPLPADDFRAFEAATGHRILERYGMSETLFTLSNPFDGERRPGTVGLPVSGCEVRIVDEGGEDVPEGELGEIVVKGHGLMTGYWGRPEETAASFRDGWFLTGDVARRDASGYVTIVGRKSVDIIKSGGFKISAREIEDVLRRHPHVLDVAVVGVPDRVWGQRIVAAVVPKPGSPAGAAPLFDDLTAFASRFLADYKCPRAVHVLAELPRNALGKVQKHVVIQLLGSAG
jgi:acyl-CoA synthetase (AMP-forming)/AMP-acid ligase II